MQMHSYPELSHVYVGAFSRVTTLGKHHVFLDSSYTLCRNTKTLVLKLLCVLLQHKCDRLDVADRNCKKGFLKYRCVL